MPVQVQVSGAIMDLEVSWDKAIVTVAAGETVHFFDTGWSRDLDSARYINSSFSCLDARYGWYEERLGAHFSRPPLFSFTKGEVTCDTVLDIARS